MQYPDISFLECVGNSVFVPIDEFEIQFFVLYIYGDCDELRSLVSKNEFVMKVLFLECVGNAIFVPIMSSKC